LRRERFKFTRRQPAVNASVTSIWDTDESVRPHSDATIGRTTEMGMRKTTIVALIAMAGLSAPLQQGMSFAQGAPAAMATAAMASSLSPDDKTALLKKLRDAKARDKHARRGYSTEPLTQAGYDRKITQINRLIEKLNKGTDFPLSDADDATASPGKAEPN
jgi:hypothetical protein